MVVLMSNYNQEEFWKTFIPGYTRTKAYPKKSTQEESTKNGKE